MTSRLALLARTIDSRDLWPLVCGVCYTDLGLFSELYHTDGGKLNRLCIEDLVWKMYYDSTRSFHPGIIAKAFELEPRLTFLGDMYFGEWMIFGEFAQFLLGMRDNYFSVDVMVWRLHRIPKNLDFVEEYRGCFVQFGDRNICLFETSSLNCHSCHNMWPHVGIIKGDFVYNFASAKNVLSLQTMALESLAKCIRNSNQNNGIKSISKLNSALEKKNIIVEPVKEIELKCNGPVSFPRCSNDICIQLNKMASFSIVSIGIENELMCLKTKAFRKCLTLLCTYLNVSISYFRFVKNSRTITVYLNEKHVASIVYDYGTFVLVAKKENSYYISGYSVEYQRIYNPKSFYDFNKKFN
jgi:hypothetical protein